jgi:tRNA (guanine37-N1)-methyltransferase
VTGWEEYGGPALLEVDNGRILIPFVKAICVDIRPADRVMRNVTLPDGASTINEALPAGMKFHLLTIFPDFFDGSVPHGVVARAAQAGALEIHLHDLRNWTHDVHRTVDDRPFGGGEGMLLKPEPIFERRRNHLAGEVSRAKGDSALRAGPQIHAEGRPRTRFTKRTPLICGRYEGVDERVAEHLADDELSIGDYVLSGGELAAAIVIDTRGASAAGRSRQQDSSVNESFEEGILDCPQWTRPADFRGWKVAQGSRAPETPAPRPAA